ncbi:MAG: four helix bundle protein [Actinomycetota bacterium]
MWKRSSRLVHACYGIADALPDYEKFGLASQICRAAVSIPSNVAEGAGRASDKEFARFVNIAFASACELETQLRLVDGFGVVDPDVLKRVRGEALGVRRMLHALHASLVPSNR